MLHLKSTTGFSDFMAGNPLASTGIEVLVLLLSLHSVLYALSFALMILLTRKVDFSSAHFYWNPALSDAENDRVFGKGANRQGHGHNYTLEVTIAGDIEPVTGFVVDLKRLKDILEREVVSVYDHRHLNYEVADFATTIPTTENIAIAIWHRLEGKIPDARLHRIRVYEMPDLFADYYGEYA